MTDVLQITVAAVQLLITLATAFGIVGMVRAQVAHLGQSLKEVKEAVRDAVIECREEQKDLEERVGDRMDRIEGMPPRRRRR